MSIKDAWAKKNVGGNTERLVKNTTPGGLDSTAVEVKPRKIGQRENGEKDGTR